MADKRYRHRITGHVIRVGSEIKSKDWILLDSAEDSDRKSASTVPGRSEAKNQKACRREKAVK